MNPIKCAGELRSPARRFYVEEGCGELRSPGQRLYCAALRFYVVPRFSEEEGCGAKGSTALNYVPRPVGFLKSFSRMRVLKLF